MLMYKLRFKFKSMFIKETKLYQNELINNLHKEHQTLFNIYLQLNDEKNNKKRLKLFKKFYYEYHLHILKEDKQLYTFLLNKYTFVPETFNKIKEKEKEMQEITAFIEGMAKKYSTLSAIESEDFQKDLNTVGEVLTKRVEFEEKELYAYY